MPPAPSPIPLIPNSAAPNQNPNPSGSGEAESQIQSPEAPDVAGGHKPLPINLATALQLANVEPIDVRVASARVRLGAAQLEYAKLLWLPTLEIGPDFFRHDGQIQDAAGDVTTNSHDSFMFGAGPSMVFAVTDAIFEPLAARQVLGARRSALQTAQNDSLLAVTDAYFTVQQSRGELAGAQDVARRSAGLVHRAQKLLVGGLAPELEVVRARAQARRSRQLVQSAGERWRVSSADLTRVLRLDSSALAEPLEPPHLQVTLVALDQPVDGLIELGLMRRPELATQRQLVQATISRIRQERLRPLVPSILLRGSSTSVTGTLAGGLFAGGPNDEMGSWGPRLDLDLQILWELKELGFGNHALVRQREAENEVAVLELFRTQDRIAAEVAQAFAEAKSAAARLVESEAELKDAVDSADKNMQGLTQTRNIGNLLLTVVRPQEVVASLQALSQAYVDYYGSVADYDRAQFRLYHALGNPAGVLAANGGLDLPPAAPAQRP